MSCLLDTHIAVWAALQPDALTQAERLQMEQSKRPLVLSAVSVWELSLKWHSVRVSGERKGPISPASIVAFATAMEWRVLPLTAQHAATRLTHPLDHKDPFDEMLLVQAQAEGLRLLTRDVKLVSHPLAMPLCSSGDDVDK